MGLMGFPWGWQGPNGVATWLVGSLHGWRSYHGIAMGLVGLLTGWQCPQVVGGVSKGLARSPKGWKGPHRVGRVPTGSAESPQGRISSGSLSPSGSCRSDIRKSAENPPKICRIWSQMVNGLGAGLGAVMPAVATCSGSCNKPIFKQHSSTNFNPCTKFVFIIF